MWAECARTNRDLGQRTTGAVEGWHSSLKSKACVAKKRLIARRPDWLVGVLTGAIDDFYADMGRVKDAGGQAMMLCIAAHSCCFVSAAVW